MATSAGGRTNSGNDLVSKDGYRILEQIEENTGISAYLGIDQVITPATARPLGYKDFFRKIGIYFLEIGILESMVKMMVTPESAENALSDYRNFARAITDQTIQEHRESFYDSQRGFLINKILLQASALLPTHKTGLLFEKGLIQDAATNNIRE